MKRILTTLFVLTTLSLAGQEMSGNSMMMMSMPTTVDFTTLDDAAHLAESRPTVLFFHADWCPFCRETMAEIDARIPELGNIAIVVVDYDRERRLKRTFGVTYQHTFVQIDAEGNAVALWNGGGVDGILSHVDTM